jgi:signal transduction histidine kinase
MVPPLRQQSGSRLPVPSCAALLAVQLFGTHFAQHTQPGRHPLDAIAVLLLVAGPLLLLGRLRHPVGALVGTAAVCVAYLLLGYPYGPVFLSVAVGFVHAVLSGHRRAAWACGAGLYAVHLATALAGPGPVVWQQELGVAAWVGVVGAAAEVIRVRREQIAQHRRVRADEQRLEIARELHDVLAHSISLINVQAGVALELIDEQPEQARTALVTIKQASKEALGEVRQVLGTLRGPEARGGTEAASAAAPRTPAPGLGRLDELVRQAGLAGLRVELRREGSARPLPQGVELAAFRIVQEALTNIIRHSAARRAELVVSYAPDALELTVEDGGPASSGGGEQAGGSGNGLAGMRERVAALGGGVEAGSTAAGGFRVRATLPAPEAGARWESRG